MQPIGFIGLGAMGQPMATNLQKKSGRDVLGFDVMRDQCADFVSAGGKLVDDVAEIYKNCSIIMLCLPSHDTVISAVEQAVIHGKPGNIIVDLSSTAPSVIADLNKLAGEAGIYLLDAPISGGNPMAIAGTLAIMAGGDPNALCVVWPLLNCLGSPVCTGGSGTGSLTKLVNNIVAGAYLVAMSEAYAFALKAGLDLQTTFEATRGGFAGGPMYENKVPKLIKKDYSPGARIAVHRKDIINAKQYAHQMGVDLPLTDVILHVMDWMGDNGHINEDQIAMIKYYEEKMKISR